MGVLAEFGRIDVGIVAGYFLLVIAIGFIVGRRHGRDQAAGEYFLGGRSMPTWAVAISLVATMLSSATFVGVPDIAFGGDLTYLILNLGGILAVFIVALFFVPVLYRAGTVTIYGFLAQRFGEEARLAVSGAFIVGRILSSAARLFVAAIPLAQLLFHVAVPNFPQLVEAILLIGAIGTIYATLGGVRAVVWVDTVQFALVMGTALLTIGILVHRIPLSLPEMFHALQSPPTGPSKLRLLDFSTDPGAAFTFWTAIFGNTFLMVAAFGCDHDLAQRFLITRSARRGAFSIIAAQFISIAVVLLFLVIGLLLYLFYKDAGAGGAVAAEGISVYPRFLIDELPTGLAGFAIVGFFAVAQGSLDSAMNALAASIVADIYLPLRGRGRPGGEQGAARSSKLTVAAVGLGMTLVAIFCALLYDPKQMSLINFVLGLMTFALSGMLAVFLTALFTRRGNSESVIAALITGAAVVTLLHDRVYPRWTKALLGAPQHLAWPWWMPIATTVAFLVCIAGKPARKRAGFEPLIE
jgi:SSS family transporter